MFATPDSLVACIFAFKNSGCRTIVRTVDGLVVVFDSTPPAPDAKGQVYEVAPEGFRQTMRRGQPSGKWAMVESDMPHVRDIDGSEVPGLPVGDPVRQVAIRDLIEQDGLRVCILTNAVDAVTYSAAARDAIHLGAETIFMREAVERGWLRDITDHLYTGRRA